jgi:CsoR family transcriptional regulator, copper-sensing transcriptional repressor
MTQLTDPIKKKAIRSRLARVEGQLRGVQRLIDDEPWTKPFSPWWAA